MTIRKSLVDQPELCKVLSVSTWTVDELIRKDEDFPVIRVGRLRRFCVDEVLAYLRSAQRIAA